MAAPTLAESATQLKNAVKPHTDLEAHFPTQVADYDAAEQDLEGDRLPAAVTGGMADLRRRLSQAMDWFGRCRGIADAWALEVMRVAGQPTDDLWGRVHRYLHEQSQTFNDRNWTRGSASAGGGNTGTGTLRRLTVDWEAYNLQGGHVETKTFECVQDQSLGTFKGAEVFRVAGEDASKDNLDYQGSGMVALLVAKHSGTGVGASVLRNSGWDAQFSGTGTDKIPGWTIGGTASKITAGTSGYRTAPGASSQGTLVFDNDGAATNEVTQALSLQRLSAGSERVPWMLQVAYKKSSAGATGSLVLKIGNKSTTLDLSTIADTDWHVLQFTIDKNLYYRNWKEDAPDIEVEVVNLSAGTLTLDDLIFAQWDLLDGTWYWLTGGATAFLQRDSFTVADSGPTAATSEMIYFLARCGVLPMGTDPGAVLNLPVNNAGGETITDP